MPGRWGATGATPYRECAKTAIWFVGSIFLAIAGRRASSREIDAISPVAAQVAATGTCTIGEVIALTENTRYLKRRFPRPASWSRQLNTPDDLHLRDIGATSSRRRARRGSPSSICIGLFPSIAQNSPCC